MDAEIKDTGVRRGVSSTGRREPNRSVIMTFAGSLGNKSERTPTVDMHTRLGQTASLNKNNETILLKRKLINHKSYKYTISSFSFKLYIKYI